MHARDTAHAVGALAETQERRQEARSCAGILDEELERLRLLHETTRQDLSNFLLESLQRLTEPADEGASTARTAKSNDS